MTKPVVVSILFLVMTVAMAACTGTPVDTVSQSESDVDERAASNAQVEGSSDPEVESVLTATPEPTQTVIVQPTATETVKLPTATESVVEVAVPTVRVGLSATSPGSVNLASGGLQLIEFFAYW